MKELSLEAERLVKEMAAMSGDLCQKIIEEQLRAIIEELPPIVKDAERYRWLRDHQGSNRLPHLYQYPPAMHDRDTYDAVQMNKHGADAAIDAAMRLPSPTDAQR